MKEYSHWKRSPKENVQKRVIISVTLFQCTVKDVLDHNKYIPSWFV